MEVEKVELELTRILQSMIEKDASINEVVKDVHPDYALSARNLYRYLILRSYDLRKYHDDLSDIGLSSLRTAEGYVFSNLYNVIKQLRLIQGKSMDDSKTKGIKLIGYKKSKEILKHHASLLFNESHHNRFTEIMVTLPNEAAEGDMIEQLVLSGMEIARINLSHGDFEIWQGMVDKVKEVERKTGQEVKIYMDLSGPKIRTASIEVKSKKGKVKNGIKIREGEHIILTKRATLGKKSKFGPNDEQLSKGEVGVMLHEIIDDAKIGDVILFDDGMIKAKVIGKNAEDLELEITACHKQKLASHKGINLPHTQLHLPALTRKDMECLPFICQHADMVGYSFVRTGSDVAKLYRELSKYDTKDLGVVFKIENRESFENMPEILIQGMKRNKIGVMIARGDLAVEIGFERIAEVQNQILWLCESAHIPVIWATQVLENLAKSGMPTRAEISDAAQSAQAECVMLNKGPFINEAVRVLQDIIVRMEGHSFKKKNELRALHISQRFVEKLKATS